MEKITHLTRAQTIRISQKNALYAKEHFLPTENYVEYIKNGSINTRTFKNINDNNQNPKMSYFSYIFYRHIL